MRNRAVPHVLYNHLTHPWDPPDLDDGSNDTAHVPEEPPQFGPCRGRRITHMALGIAALFAGFMAWGMLAGLFLEISQE